MPYVASFPPLSAHRGRARLPAPAIGRGAAVGRARGGHPLLPARDERGRHRQRARRNERDGEDVPLPCEAATSANRGRLFEGLPTGGLQTLRSVLCWEAADTAVRLRRCAPTARQPSPVVGLPTVAHRGGKQAGGERRSPFDSLRLLRAFSMGWPAMSEPFDFAQGDSNGGERGIRTLGRVSPTHAFQACAFNHSAISPFGTPRKWK